MSALRVMTLYVLGFILLSAVNAHKACSKNANLWKSIQYQLKLVETTEGRCDCDKKEMHGHEMVGFLAKSSKDKTNVNSGTTVIFDKVVTNTGSGYDASTGQFVAPYEGLYYFTWTILTYPSKKFLTQLLHNNNIIAGNYPDGRGRSSGHDSATQSVVLHLAAKDKVCIKTEDTGQYMYGDRWSTFSGYKI
ncbi:complement C1q tumor necrosis factor-related protein 3-like [Mytilus trossulus]|uniref:complement C1q tumor necrosis factor-related protein 3-like n=1 Tax=Mytilus trossulus TaxID=6551 RepID=UPI00300585BC